MSRAAGEGKHWKRLSGNVTGRRLQRFFKEQSKLGRSHQTIQRIRETRGTKPPSTWTTHCDNMGKRSMRDIVIWSQNLSPCNHEEAGTRIM